jgi:hypothetical protein
MMAIISCFFNEYFLQHSFINIVKLSKNVRKWRDFYNPYCNPPSKILHLTNDPVVYQTVWF